MMISHYITESFTNLLVWLNVRNQRPRFSSDLIRSDKIRRTILVRSYCLVVWPGDFKRSTARKAKEIDWLISGIFARRDVFPISDRMALVNGIIYSFNNLPFKVVHFLILSWQVSIKLECQKKNCSNNFRQLII
jgi:hypothetical protein